MEPKAFQVGDVVKLRSGGMSMTVVFAGSHTIEVACYTDGRFVTRRLPPEALVIMLGEEPAAGAAA